MDSSSSSHLLKNEDEKVHEDPPIKDATVNKYGEIMSTLPREKDWAKSCDDLYQYQGFWYTGFFLEGILSAQDHFKARSTDILLVSCMKTGTTWLKALAFAIFTRASFDTSSNPLLSKGPHDCIPFLEVDLAQEYSRRDMEIQLLNTHIPYTSLPKSIIDSGCKIVYIWRDPKDVFISTWFYVGKVLAFMGFEPLPMEESFELFCRGILTYGPYWDHVLGYWKAKLEFPDRILFLKYEEMQKDTYFYVKKLAEFMGYPFTSLEEENGVAHKITEFCNFENLSNLQVNKSGKHRENTPMAIDNNIFFRKGKVGDWENHLTPEMGARLDGIMKHKLMCSGLIASSHEILCPPKCPK
ncbi:hypothetical protein P3X46_031230 [Hevea brasiliensis]|uniref:Sulfotransferase n=2 Tax=Hevea brasiliensis TaxID=3981 RepID=A0ABQ9KLB8_HEVBR|nr:hypothetical protein P3X46_031230 [Hevea brasiliensis]